MNRAIISRLEVALRAFLSNHLPFAATQHSNRTDPEQSDRTRLGHQSRGHRISIRLLQIREGIAIKAEALE